MWRGEIRRKRPFDVRRNAFKSPYYYTSGRTTHSERETRGRVRRQEYVPHGGPGQKGREGGRGVSEMIPQVRKWKERVRTGNSNLTLMARGGGGCELLTGNWEPNSVRAMQRLTGWLTECVLCVVSESEVCRAD